MVFILWARQEVGLVISSALIWRKHKYIYGSKYNSVPWHYQIHVNTSAADTLAVIMEQKELHCWKFDKEQREKQ